MKSQAVCLGSELNVGETALSVTYARMLAHVFCGQGSHQEKRKISAFNISSQSCFQLLRQGSLSATKHHVQQSLS